MKLTTGILACGVLAAVCVSANSANAAMITYSNVSSNGITISNITETNNYGPGTFAFGSPTAPAYYGQPSFVNGNLTFGVGTAGTLPFMADAISGSSEAVTAELRFEVTSSVPMSASAFLTEEGDFYGFGGGFASDSSYLYIFDAAQDLPAEATGSATVTPTTPFWTSSTGAAASVPATTFYVVLDNNLVAGSPTGASSAEIDKKSLSITIGQGGTRPPVPEPASLGLLGAGAVALIARRRKA